MSRWWWVGHNNRLLKINCQIPNLNVMGWEHVKSPSCACGSRWVWWRWEHASMHPGTLSHIHQWGDIRKWSMTSLGRVTEMQWYITLFYLTGVSKKEHLTWFKCWLQKTFGSIPKDYDYLYILLFYPQGYDYMSVTVFYIQASSGSIVKHDVATL